MEHGPGLAREEQDGQLYIYCLCGNQYCNEEWDYDALYLASGPKHLIDKLRSYHG